MESHINKHFIFVGKRFRGRGRYKRNSAHCILWGNLKYSAVRRATLERAIKISNSDVREPVEKYSPISNHDNQRAYGEIPTNAASSTVHGKKTKKNPKTQNYIRITVML